MTKSILVVDDEARISRMVARYLREARHAVFEAADGQEALAIMAREPVDLVILDLMMPRLNGEGFLRAIRRTSDVYVIVLTARTGEDAQVGTYNMGADDFVEKPFSCKALVSKVNAVLARLDGKAPGKRSPLAEGPAFCPSFGLPDGLTIDSQSRKVYVDGIDCRLKPREYALLCYLAANRNLALSREQILDSVWGVDYTGGDRTVDIHISNLRRKLADKGGCIRTISGYGYRLEARP